MSSPPAIENLEFYRGTDWTSTYIFANEDASGNVTPHNLNGQTILAQAWDKNRTYKYADFAVTYTDRPNGEFSLKITDDLTLQFPDIAYYDVVLVSTGGDRETYVKGKINTLMGYSR